MMMIAPTKASNIGVCISSFLFVMVCLKRPDRSESLEVRLLQNEMYRCTAPDAFEYKLACAVKRSLVALPTNSERPSTVCSLSSFLHTGSSTASLGSDWHCTFEKIARFSGFACDTGGGGSVLHSASDGNNGISPWHKFGASRSCLSALSFVFASEYGAISLVGDHEARAGEPDAPLCPDSSTIGSQQPRDAIVTTDSRCPRVKGSACAPFAARPLMFITRHSCFEAKYCNNSSLSRSTTDKTC
mmetsp:Transcript_94656/g.167650  ORF Transcript_94656/g.167650 Transcript_94656/m.167650 type:complete len:244 (-) Transcript_94656:87-818(-)